MLESRASFLSPWDASILILQTSKGSPHNHGYTRVYSGGYEGSTATSTVSSTGHSAFLARGGEHEILRQLRSGWHTGDVGYPATKQTAMRKMPEKRSTL